MSLRRSLVVAASAVAVLGSPAAGLSGPTGIGSPAACAASVKYNGHVYVGMQAKVAPVAGKKVARVTVPPCRDTPDAPREVAERVELAVVVGLSPKVAVVRRDDRRTIYVRDDVDLADLPRALARLLRTPRCNDRDEPIKLSGPWLGILSAGGQTEADLAPRYDINLLAAQASPSRYLRAYLTVRVPAALGRPLNRHDIESSLWQGGTISVSVRCRAGQYVAEHVKARPR